MYKLGIDIGGTKIRGVLLNAKNKIIADFEILTPKTKKEFIGTLKYKVGKLTAEKGINKIGIGAAGVIGKNKIIFSPNISYLKNFNFYSVFPGAIFKIDNDARAFLRGEIAEMKKSDRNKKILAFTIGTGIGRAFAKNGKVKKIKNFEYPEKWEKEYQKIRDTGRSAELARFLTDKLSVIIKKYNPEIVIIGGGILGRKDFFRQLKRSLNKKAKSIGMEINIQKAKSESSAALGAALLFD